MDDQQNEAQDLSVGTDGSLTESGADTAPTASTGEDFSQNSTESFDSESLQATTPQDDLTPPPQDEPQTAEGSGSNEAMNNNEVVQEPAYEENTTEMNADNPAATNDYSSETPSVDSTQTSSLNTSQQTPQPASVTQSSEHHNNKKVLIFVVLLAGIVLAGAAIYVYLSAQNNTQETTAVPSTQQTEEVTPATATDVDQVSNDVDAALQELDDAADFSDEALSDDSLGL